MVPLRVRSHFSLYRGTASPAALCERAKKLGFTALALTDRDNLYGLWDFVAACRREDLRPMVGAELSEPATERLVTCLVQSEKGYSNLCHLISERHTDQDFTLQGRVARYREGLLILCGDGELLTALHGCGVAVAADLGARPTEPGRQLRRLAAALHVPAVATPDSELLDDDDRALHLLLRAIGANRSLSAVTREYRSSRIERLAGPDEYRRRFDVWPEVVAATELLAARCTFAGPDFGVVMPPWRGDDGRLPAQVLREKAYRGACLRYGDDLGEVVVERLEHELRIIEQMGFSSYFLVVRDIVHRLESDGSRKKRRICGRGSGAASLVAYCLEITNVCPIKYNLYFERFLNPGRTDPPDIDIDFSWDERDEVLADVLGDFKDHSAMVCNHVFFQPRMAIRETAKAFGLPGREITGLTSRIPWMHRTGDDSLQSRLAEQPALRDQDLSEPWPEILALAGRLIGLPRYISVHPGGVVITPRPIRDYVPVEMATKGVPIIQWEKDGSEEAGLVKIDLLGNRSLGVIRDALAAVAAGGTGIDEMQWVPEDDGPTRMAVARGATMGCFYIESPAMRLLQQKAGTGDFEQLVIQSSIIRPAANDFVREYVRRLHGGAWSPLCPEIGDVLDESFGLMVYQEDVSKVAVAVAGFSHADGDGLRKVMSKKDRVHRLIHYREQFFAGCRERGVATEAVEKMWQMMMSFDGYSFCKPHSASYARVSFQAAFLKTHFPAEFMAAVISNQGGYYSAFGYVSEAKRLGLSVLHPDVTRSGLRWTGCKKEIRVGLQSIHGLSDLLQKKIVAQRETRPFAGLDDFFMRVQPADDEARALIQCGALDSLASGLNRTALLWQWACFHRAMQQNKGAGLLKLQLPSPPPLPPPDALSCARTEFRLLGFLCCDHPLQYVKMVDKSTIHIEDLKSRIGCRVRLRCWLLTGKLISTKTGEVMEFLTFEDETGLVETTFFPAVYRAHAHLLQSGHPYEIVGLVEEDYGALTVTVEKLVPVGR